MFKCGKLIATNKKYLTDKEIEDFVIGSFQAFCKLRVFLYGYIYEEGEGVYLIGPPEELRKVCGGQPFDTQFDFEEYMDSTNKFWLANYTGKSPVIQRMTR